MSPRNVTRANSARRKMTSSGFYVADATESRCRGGAGEERRVTRSRKQIETVTTSARAGNADISAMARKRDDAEFARERGNFRWPKLLYGITSVVQLPCRRRYRRKPTETRCVRVGPQLLRICRYFWQVARSEFHPSLPFRGNEKSELPSRRESDLT